MDDGVPLFAGHRRERVVAGDAGIADHAVIRAMGGDVGLDGGGAAGAVGDVEFQHTGSSSERLDLGDDGIGEVAAAAAMHGDVEAIAGEPQRDRAADAAAGAGDEDAAIGHERGSSR